MIPLITSASSSQTKGAIVPIAYQSVTESAGVDSLYFNNIPQGYQDLMIVWSVKSNNVNTTLSDSFIRINNDTDASLRYSSTWVEFNGAAGTGNSTRETNAQFASIAGLMSSGNSVNPSTFALNQIYIMDYTATDKFKTILCKSSLDLNGSGKSRVGVGLYRSFGAVSAFNVYNAGNFPGGYFSMAGTFCAVYGIRGPGQ